MRAEQGRDGVQRVARALCRFRWVAYDGVPPAERPAYVRLQLLAWSPFAESGYALARARDGAMAFSWDQRAFAQRAATAGLPVQAAQTLPETLLLPAHENGVVLQACVLGVEGQFWREGQLVASRWWPDIPDAAAWLNFQRSAGVPPDAQVEQPPRIDPDAQPVWLDEPWAPVSTLSSMLERARLRWHLAAAALLAALLLPTLWLWHAYWSVSGDIQALAAEKALLTEQAQPILKARNQALTALTQLDTLRAVVSHPDALSLLGHLAAQLPADAGRVRNLELDGSRLRLVLAVPAAGGPRIAYVRALEGGLWLQNVREEAQEAGPGTVALTAQIRGNEPMVAPKPDAARPAASAASAPAQGAKP